MCLQGRILNCSSQQLPRWYFRAKTTQAKDYPTVINLVTWKFYHPARPATNNDHFVSFQGVNGNKNDTGTDIPNTCSISPAPREWHGCHHSTVVCKSACSRRERLPPHLPHTKTSQEREDPVCGSHRRMAASCSSHIYTKHTSFQPLGTHSRALVMQCSL